MTDLQSCTVGWREHDYSMRSFFQRMAQTLDGEAKRFYTHEHKKVLQKPERDAAGRVVRDDLGRVVLIQDPVRLWGKMLHHRFMGRTRTGRQNTGPSRPRPTETPFGPV